MNDFHVILDLDYNATEEQIRTQYRQLVRIYHPDRFSNPSDKEYAERKLQEINEAYYGLLAPERTGKGVNRRLTQSEQKYPILSSAPSSVMILLSVLFVGVLLGGLDYEALLSDDPSLAGKTFGERLMGADHADDGSETMVEQSHEWLSFSVFEDYRNVLYVVGADGQPQLEFPVPGHAPAWSPKRDQLAFLSSEREGTQIYTVSLAELSLSDQFWAEQSAESDGRSRPHNAYGISSEELSRITRDTDNKNKLVWSPDGSMLAYIAQTNESQESILKVAHLQSGEIASVTSPRMGTVQTISWLDNTSLLADLDANGNRQVFQISMDGQAAAPFVNFPSRDPSTSPSGQRVAVASDEGIFTVLQNGTELTQLTTFPAWHPVWSPSGREIAYLSPPIQPDTPLEKERSALWVMEANGDNPEQLTESGILSYAWSIDGTELAYITGNLQIKPPTLYLWRSTLDGTQTLVAEISEAHISWGRGP